MNKRKIIENLLLQKRNELIKNLFIYQEYNYVDIAFIFKLSHTTVLRIIKNEK